MPTLEIETNTGNHHELEMEDDFILPRGPDPNHWFVFSGKDGKQLSLHEANILVIHLG